MSDKHTTNFDEILDELLLRESEPSHEILMKWCIRYPEHREAFSRFFATWAVQDELPEQITIDETGIAHRMVSHALNILHRQNAARAATSEDEPVPRLSEAIASSGLTEEEFACRCGLDESIVLKLDRRLIHVVSIPRVCLERMAAALGRCVDAIEQMLAGAPIPLRVYKARGQPTIKVEDFLDAVRASDLSDEAKSEWVKTVVAEKTPRGT